VYSVQKKLYSLWSFTIEISCPLGYTIITPREHDLPSQAKRTDELKETQKKFKKGLDKNKGLWYNKSVKRARRQSSDSHSIQTDFERGNVYD